METTQSATLTATNYASFGQRFLALIIDGIVMSILYFIILTPIMTAIGLGVASEAQALEGMSEDEAATAAVGMVGAIVAAAGTAMLAVTVIQLLYFSLFESSKFQGTLGKMAMGIKVVDANGDRLSVGKAFVRSIGRIISGMILYIGYLMAAFTEKKQALHDMMANTLVVKK